MRTVICIVFTVAFSVLTNTAWSFNLAHDVGAEEMNNYLVRLYKKTPKIDGPVEKPNNFELKDPTAAFFASKPLAEWLTSCLNSEYRLRLYSLLTAAEEAGFEVGITSLCRDSFRQAMITDRMKAPPGSSYHEKGYAADVVALAPDRKTQVDKANPLLWAWIDKHGPSEFGLVRVYNNGDGGHLGPSDGIERRHFLARLAERLRKRIATAKRKAHQILVALKQHKKHVVMVKHHKRQGVKKRHYAKA